MCSLFRLIALLLVLGLTAACSQPAIKDRVSSEFAAEDLYPVKNTGFAEAYVRRDADLSSYRVVDIQPLVVSRIDIPTTAVAGTSRRDWQMTPERETALQAAWADAMTRVFSAYAPGAADGDVLRIEAQLTRMAPGRPTVTTIGRELQPMGSSQDVVEIWAEFRLFDAGSGKLLAVVRDSRTITSMSMSRTAPITVNLLFKSWAALLQTRVSGR